MLYAYLTVLLLSVCIKCYAARRLYLSRPSTAKSMCALLLAWSFGQAVLEAYMFYAAQNPTDHDTKTILKSYYVLIVMYVALLPNICFVAIKQSYPAISFYTSLLVAIVLAIYCAMTDYIVLDAKVIGDIITRIPGPYYFVFSLLIIGMLVTIVAIPSIIYRQSNSEIERAKCANILSGALITSITTLIIMVCMRLGLGINAMAVVPLVLSILLLTVTECIQPDSVLDIRAYLPWTQKAKALRYLNRRFIHIDTDVPIDCKLLKKEFQDQLILMASQVFLKQSEAARWLGISDSKFSRDLGRIKNSN